MLFALYLTLTSEIHTFAVTLFIFDTHWHLTSTINLWPSIVLLCLLVVFYTSVNCPVSIPNHMSFLLDRTCCTIFSALKIYVDIIILKCRNQLNWNKRYHSLRNCCCHRRWCLLLLWPKNFPHFMHTLNIFNAYSYQMNWICIRSLQQQQQRQHIV